MKKEKRLAAMHRLISVARSSSQQLEASLCERMMLESEVAVLRAALVQHGISLPSPCAESKAVDVELADRLQLMAAQVAIPI